MPNDITILIVDDVRLNLQLLTEMLSNAGYKVRPADGGKIAIDSVIALKPDLILLDIRMPDMDGYEVCSILKANPLTADIPVIFISALDDAADKVKAFKLGAVDFITKPFELLEVLARVKTHLELSQLRKELQRDITDRILYEETLRKSNQHNRALLELNPDLIFVFDRAGVYLECHTASPELLYLPIEDMLGKSFQEILPPDLAAAFLTAFEKAFTEKQVQVFEYELEISKNIKNFEAKFVSLDQDKLMVVIRDVTKRKQAETEKLELQKQLLDAQKLESLGIIAGGIAHDFNNILTIVLGNLEYLDYIEVDNPEIINRVDNAKTGINRAAVLVKQLMTYAGNAFYDFRDLDINLSISANDELYRANLNNKTILKYKLQQDTPLIKADKHHLEQVIANLLTNAIEAIGDKNGEINIITGMNYYDSQFLNSSTQPVKPTEGNFVFIKITDNGCGIEETILNKIFEPFFSTKFTGRGLGLASVQGIVSAHQGAIFIKSEVGVGTEITVLLPALNIVKTSENTVVKKKTVKNKVPQYQANLIIADDEEMVLEMNAAILRKFGFKILTANNGIEALNFYKANSAEIDGLMLDLVMPEMNGISVAKEIRKISKKVKIIIASGYDPKDNELKSAEIDGFIHKPFNMDEMKEMFSLTFGEFESK